MELTDKVNEIVNEMNVVELERLKASGYTNEIFFNDGGLTDQYKIKSIEKKKYINIDFGSSGGFMVNKETSEVFNIKGYGKINKKKCYGSIFNLDGRKLHGLKFDYRNIGKRRTGSIRHI